MTSMKLPPLLHEHMFWSIQPAGVAVCTYAEIEDS